MVKDFRYKKEHPNKDDFRVILFGLPICFIIFLIGSLSNNNDNLSNNNQSTHIESIEQDE